MSFTRGDMRHAVLRILGAHHAAMCLVLAGLMIASVPFGAYVVFGNHSGDTDSDVDTIGMTFAGMRLALPVDTTIGYAFGAFWCVYAAMVVVAMRGPCMNMVRAARGLVCGGGNTSWLYRNHMLDVVSWFTVLILASALIDVAQANFGVQIIPPDYGGDLNRFYDATKAPIIEEVGFRVLLIGAPLAGLYMLRQPSLCTLRSLLAPHSVHGERSVRVALGLIVVSAVFFGVLHIVGDGSWSAGKATQAGVAGIILGWVYYRHGLLAAILVHWATNYFVLAFLYFVAVVSDSTISGISAHPASLALETLLIAAGAVSAVLLILGRSRVRAKIPS